MNPKKSSEKAVFYLGTAQESAQSRNVSDRWVSCLSLCTDWRQTAVATALAAHCRLPPGRMVADVQRGLCETMMATAADRFLVICRTSFAPYLQHWLYDAGLEYGVAFTT